MEKKISEKSAFAWWVKFILRKRDHIISKTHRHWLKTHKYGICVPNTVEEAILIDKENGDTLWSDIIMKEINTVQPAFKVFKKRKEDILIGCL